jgi:hypothetical protein
MTEADPVTSLVRVEGAAHEYRATSVTGDALSLRPFFPLYDRRTAVYFKTFTPARWAAERGGYLAAEAARAELARRTVDVFHIGEQQPEHDHEFGSTRSEATQFYGKSGRSLGQGESLWFRVARRPGPEVLQLTYVWFEIDREIEIAVDGKVVAIERLPKPPKDDWVMVDYPLPSAVAPGSQVRITARKGGFTLYGVRVLGTGPEQV